MPAGGRSPIAGKGVFDVDYHFEGRLTQGLRLPADLPDNEHDHTFP
jgi:hypothetical protein